MQEEKTESEIIAQGRYGRLLSEPGDRVLGFCPCPEHRGVQPGVLVRLNMCGDIHVTLNLLTPSTEISALIPTSHALNCHGFDN